MNETTDIISQRDLIFNFLARRLDRRLTKLQALQFSNARTVDYIRERIEIFSQELKVKDIYAPLPNHTTLLDELRDYCQDLREGKPQKSGRSDDEHDEVNRSVSEYAPEENLGKTKLTKTKSTTHIQSEKGHAGTLKKDKSTNALHTNDDNASKKILVGSKGRNTAVGQKNGEEEAKGNIKKTQKTDGKARENVNGDAEGHTGRANPRKVDGTSRATSPNKIPKKSAGNPSGNGADNHVESANQDTDKGKPPKGGRPGKSIDRTATRATKKNLVEGNGEGENTSGNKSEISPAKRPKGRNETQKEIVNGRSAEEVKENLKKKPDRSRTPVPRRGGTENENQEAEKLKAKNNKETGEQRENAKENGVSKITKQEPKKIEPAKPKGGTKDHEAEKLNDRKGAKHATEKEPPKDQKKGGKGKTIENPPVETIVQSMPVGKETKIKGPKAEISHPDIKEAPVKVSKKREGKKTDSEKVPGKDTIDASKQADDKSDRGAKHENTRDEVRAEERSSARKKPNGANEVSPEKKIKHFSSTSSSKKRNLELNIDEIEKDASTIEGWEKGPDTQDERDQNDALVNGDYDPNERDDHLHHEIKKIEEAGNNAEEENLDPNDEKQPPEDEDEDVNDDPNGADPNEADPNENEQDPNQEEHPDEDGADLDEAEADLNEAEADQNEAEADPNDNALDVNKNEQEKKVDDDPNEDGQDPNAGDQDPNEDDHHAHEENHKEEMHNNENAQHDHNELDQDPNENDQAHLEKIDQDHHEKIDQEHHEQIDQHPKQIDQHPNENGQSHLKKIDQDHHEKIDQEHTEKIDQDPTEKIDQDPTEKIDQDPNEHILEPHENKNEEKDQVPNRIEQEANENKQIHYENEQKPNAMTVIVSKEVNIEVSKEVPSPEKKVKHFSMTSSSKKRNLALDVEAIEQDMIEGWGSTQNQENQEDAPGNDEHDPNAEGGNQYESEADNNEGGDFVNAEHGTQVQGVEEDDVNGDADVNEHHHNQNDPNEAAGHHEDNEQDPNQDPNGDPQDSNDQDPNAADDDPNEAVTDDKDPNVNGDGGEDVNNNVDQDPNQASPDNDNSNVNTDKAEENPNQEERKHEPSQHEHEVDPNKDDPNDDVNGQTENRQELQESEAKSIEQPQESEAKSIEQPQESETKSIEQPQESEAKSIDQPQEFEVKSIEQHQALEQNILLHENHAAEQTSELKHAEPEADSKVIKSLPDISTDNAEQIADGTPVNSASLSIEESKEQTDGIEAAGDQEIGSSTNLDKKKVYVVAKFKSGKKPTIVKPPVKKTNDLE